MKFIANKDFIFDPQIQVLVNNVDFYKNVVTPNRDLFFVKDLNFSIKGTELLPQTLNL